MKTKLALVLVLMGLSSSALAWNAYHLYNKGGTDHWAVECADGTLWSYAGSSGGLSTVGPALCEGHGGIADPGGNGDIQVRPAVKCNAVNTGRPTVRPRPHTFRNR